MGSHSGTHLDAPRHFFPEGATLDEYPMDRLVGPGVIVDVRPQTVGSALIDAALLSERLRLAGAVPGDFILLWTGGAFLSPEAAAVLLDTGTTLVGTDGSSLDPPPPVPSDGPSGRAEVADDCGGLCRAPAPPGKRGASGRAALQSGPIGPRPGDLRFLASGRRWNRRGSGKGDCLALAMRAARDRRGPPHSAGGGSGGGFLRLRTDPDGAVIPRRAVDQDGLETDPGLEREQEVERGAPK